MCFSLFSFWLVFVNLHHFHTCSCFSQQRCIRQLSLALVDHHRSQPTQKPLEPQWQEDPKVWKSTTQYLPASFPSSSAPSRPRPPAACASPASHLPGSDGHQCSRWAGGKREREMRTTKRRKCSSFPVRRRQSPPSAVPPCCCGAGWRWWRRWGRWPRGWRTDRGPSSQRQRCRGGVWRRWRTTPPRRAPVGEGEGGRGKKGASPIQPL